MDQKGELEEPIFGFVAHSDQHSDEMILVGIICLFQN